MPNPKEVKNDPRHSVKHKFEGGISRMKTLKKRIDQSLISLICNNSGDQITGWLIVVLLVVVTGAVFLVLYQDSITDIWQGIIGKMKSTFGI